jgi:hypothetical protein
VEGDNLSLSKLLTPDKLSNCLLFLWQIIYYPLQWWSIFDNLSEVHENCDKLYPSLGVTSTICQRSIKKIQTICIWCYWKLENYADLRLWLEKLLNTFTYFDYSS